MTFSPRNILIVLAVGCVATAGLALSNPTHFDLLKPSIKGAHADAHCRSPLLLQGVRSAHQEHVSDGRALHQLSSDGHPDPLSSTTPTQQTMKENPCPSRPATSCCTATFVIHPDYPDEEVWLAAIVTVTHEDWKPGSHNAAGDWVPNTVITQPKKGHVHLTAFYVEPHEIVRVLDVPEGDGSNTFKRRS